MEYTKWKEQNGFLEHRIINGKEYTFKNNCSDYYDDQINALLLCKSDELDGEMIDGFSFSPYSEYIEVSTKETKEEIEKRKKEDEELMEYVKDKSYRGDINKWKVENNCIWYWNTNYYKPEKTPKWVRVTENFEAIILRMKNKTEEERCRYRNCSFGNWRHDDFIYQNINKEPKKRIYSKSKNPIVYKYINKETNMVDYVGIVWSANRKLSKRIKEHSKYDEMNLEKYEVYYFDVETKSDAEIWEGHLISYYGTQERLNKSKSNWGLCTFLKGKEDSIEWIKYEVGEK